MPAQRGNRQNATSMRHEITLQRETTSKSGTGKITPTWSDITTELAQVETKKVRRVLNSGQVVEETLYYIRLRYRDDLISKGNDTPQVSHRMRVVYNNRNLTVHAAAPDELRRFVELTAYSESNS